MRAIVTAVVAAIEGCVAGLVSIAAIAIPAVLLWVWTFGISVEQETVTAAVAGVWLLAHLVPMQISLSPEMMLGFGAGTEPLSFVLSLAPLAVTLITVLFAVRAGLRLGNRGGRGAAGLVGAAVGFALVATAGVTVAGNYNPWPLAGAITVVTLVYVVPAAFAFMVAAVIADAPWWLHCVRALQRGIAQLGVTGTATLPARAATVWRLGAASVAVIAALSAFAVAAALTTSFADVIAIAQSLQLDLVGSILIFALQLALLPIAVVWAAAWLSGTGFSFAGRYSPFEQAEGVLPAIPMLGALPDGGGSWGVLAPTLVVLANVFVGALFARRAELRRVSWPVAIVLPVMSAVLVGLSAAGASALASGAVGPGQLAATGPDVWLTAAVVAGEAAVGLTIGVAAARFELSRISQVVVLPEPIATWNADRRAAREAAWSASPDEAETVDLSRVRDDIDAEPMPGVDLFDGVLHERPMPAAADESVAAEIAAFGFSPASEIAGEPELEAEIEPAAELEAEAELETDPASEFASEFAPELASEFASEFDPAETAQQQPLHSAVEAGADAGANVEAEAGDDADDLLRAFSWDAAEVEAREEPKPRTRFGIPGWRNSRE